MKPSPLAVLPKSIALLLSGRPRFPKDRVGAVLTTEDGRKYTIFREVLLDPDRPREPQGVFRVWFHTRMSPRNTIRMSYLTILGFLGFPGFRSKLWLIDEATGDFGGSTSSTPWKTPKTTPTPMR